MLAILFGAVVGLALGLTGGGGSIFAVPLLVYGLDFDLRRAVALSLAVVGLTAAYGAVLQARRGLVRWRAGAILGIGGVVAAPVGAWIGGWMPEGLALALFSLLMLGVGGLMLRGNSATTEVPLEWVTCPKAEGAAPAFSWLCAARLLGTGAVTGVLAGAFGVGGGFLVVPALLVVLRLDLAAALATSLVAIGLVAASGFLSHLAQVEAGDAVTGALFLAGAGAGMSGGVAVKKHLPAAGLKKLFGWAVIGTGLLVFVRNLFHF